MDPELKDILESPEGHRLDFKRTDALDDDTGLARHLVAFANRYGGKLVFGVRDNGELEGADIDKEVALRSVRTVSRVRCNPPVEFEETLYEKIIYDGRTGDILIVDITPKQASPHAVVGGGNNLKRKFFVRTADESRPITDSEELRHLFVASSDPSFKEVIRTSIVHDSGTYQPINLRPKLPGWSDYRQFLERLTDEDRSFLSDQDAFEEGEEQECDERLQQLEDGEYVSSILLREMFPSILFDSFRRRSPDFWINRVASNDDEYQAYIQHTEPLSFGDLNEPDEKLVLPELSINLDRVFYTRAPLLLVPVGTKAVVHPPTSSDPSSNLVIAVGDNLQIDIEIPPATTSAFGRPKGYPGLLPESQAVFSQEYDLNILADFGFPDVEDPYIRVHKAFAEGILELVKHRWDINEFERRNPPSELYRISKKLDSIATDLSSEPVGDSADYSSTE